LIYTLLERVEFLMDVKCEKCGVEYELEEFPLSAEGMEVECGTCEHRFVVHGEEPPKAMWRVRKPGGSVDILQELTTLQRWIVEDRIDSEVEISKTGKNWTRLADIAELSRLLQSSEAERGAGGGGAAGRPVHHLSARPAQRSGHGSKRTFLAGVGLGCLVVAGAVMVAGLLGVTIPGVSGLFPELGVETSAVGTPGVEPSTTKETHQQDARKRPAATSVETSAAPAPTVNVEVVIQAAPPSSDKAGVGLKDEQKQAGSVGARPEPKVPAREVAKRASTLEGLLARANRMRERDRASEALLIYREVLSRESANIDALVGVAWSFFDLKRYDQSVEAFKQVLKKAPGFLMRILAWRRAIAFRGMRAWRSSTIRFIWRSCRTVAERILFELLLSA